MLDGAQYLRKATLIVGEKDGEEGIDLSELRFRFRICQSDFERPNTADIRVYNLSREKIMALTSGKVEYNRVVLQAGYQNADFGVIFDGTIKQFRIGRENQVDTYLDILAAHGDLPYNFAVINKTLAPGSTYLDRVNATCDAMQLKLDKRSADVMRATGGTLPRGKVMFSLGRVQMRHAVKSNNASWSIQNGKVVVTPIDGYREGEAVVLNSQTGMIGVPEQTEQGIMVRCLLNPKFEIGGLVKIDNASINQTIAQQSVKLTAGQSRYDSRISQEQYLANVESDGYYRVFVVDYIGDTRGREWYADLTCLAVDKSSKKVLANE